MAFSTLTTTERQILIEFESMVAAVLLSLDERGFIRCGPVSDPVEAFDVHMANQAIKAGYNRAWVAETFSRRRLARTYGMASVAKITETETERK